MAGRPKTGKAIRSALERAWEIFSLGTVALGCLTLLLMIAASVATLLFGLTGVAAWAASGGVVLFGLVLLGAKVIPTDERELTMYTNRFNFTNTKPHFINDCCFGEDLLAWIQGELNGKGFQAENPAQEDWGWYLLFRQNGVGYCLRLHYMGVNQKAKAAEWTLTLNKEPGVWDRLSGRHRRSSEADVFEVVRSVLGAKTDIEIRKES